MYQKSIIYLVLIISIFTCKQSLHNHHPAPTNGKTIVVKDGEDNVDRNLKGNWLKALHQADKNTNWKDIESQYAVQKQERKVRTPQNLRGDQENIGDGLLFGEWSERGSANQSGSVFDVEYDQLTDEFYVISAGGSLFKGKRDGSHWEVVNDDVRLNHGILKFIPTNNGRRLIALMNDIPHYSDDDGLTWSAANGVPIATSFAETFSPLAIGNDIFVLSKPDYWDKVKLYKSSDNGENYEAIHTFEDYHEKKVKLCNPHNTTDLYVLSKFSSLELHKYESSSNDLVLVSNPNISANFDRVFLVGTMINDKLTLLTYSGDNTIYRSTDGGTQWSKNGAMPDTPWAVGIYVSKYNANKRFGGAVESFKTGSIASIWEVVNDWWDYYDDVETKLHADIMAYHEFETSDGTPFMLVSNHGGLSISYDDLATAKNIGLQKLNVSQYYDVVTDDSDADTDIVYAGAQDQGFQVGTSSKNDKNPIDFDQVISGDYGHIVLTHDNKVVWKVYPDGAISATDDQGNYYDYTIESNNETVWIPPVVGIPGEDDAVLVAGGAVDGGLGSYILKIKIPNFSSGNATVSQLPFNFIDFAGSEIAYISVSPLNPDVIFASTNNSLFFYSYDGGQTFEQSLIAVPGSHYLYGSKILASSIDSNLVYMAGSGYSNPPVFKSTDKGKTFERMDDGMPSTLVFDLAFNDDETMIFAGTESAPYVYLTSEDKWFDMSGNKGPNQQYWSVEFLKNQNKVRFGTYGRGIWDFEIQAFVKTTDIVAKESLNVFPNPTKDFINIPTKDLSGKVDIKIHDLEGKLVKTYTKSIESNAEIQLNLQDLVIGRYILTLQSENRLFTSKIIKQ